MKQARKIEGPGRAHRKGIRLVELFKMFPDDPAAMKWFEDQRWPEERRCPRCDSNQTSIANSHPTMPYRCRKCRKFFSVRMGTVLEGSKLGYREWAIAIYMATTSLKGVSGIKLHRDLGISQKAAWHLMQRIRKGFEGNTGMDLKGPVEVDETYAGGMEANKPAHQKLHAGLGTVGKKAVVGLRDRQTKEDRAQVGPDPTSITLQGFVHGKQKSEAVKFTYENTPCSGRPNRLAVSHCAGQWVEGQKHTTGMDSFFSMLKRGCHGPFHIISFKHLHRCVDEFAGRLNIRDKDTLSQMILLAQGLVGKRWRYRDWFSPEGSDVWMPAASTLGIAFR